MLQLCVLKITSFVVMHLCPMVVLICPMVVLSYLDAGFEPLCPRRDFRIATCCLLLLCVMCAVEHRVFISHGQKE